MGERRESYWSDETSAISNESSAAASIHSRRQIHSGGRFSNRSPTVKSFAAEIIEMEHAGNLARDPFLRPWYAAVVAFLEAVNIATIATEVDVGCMDCGTNEKGVFLVFDIILTLAFMVDAYYQMRFFGLRKYVFGIGLPHERKVFNVLAFSHYLDLTCVGLRLADLIGTFAGGWIPIKFVTMIRVYRCKAFSTSLPSSRGVSLILTGVLIDSVKIVAWVIVLLTMLIWVVAIGITEYMANESSLVERLKFGTGDYDGQDLWGSVPSSAFTLIKILTLDNWYSDTIQTMGEWLPFMTVLLVAFVILGVMCLTSLIVASIVESAFSSSKELEAASQASIAREKTLLIASLETMIEEADTNYDGCLSRRELAKALLTHDVVTRLEQLNIRTEDLSRLHSMMSNANEHGLVRTRPFFVAATKIQGPAASIDTYQFAMDITRMVEEATAHRQTVDNCRVLIQDLIKTFQSLDSDVVSLPEDGEDPIIRKRRKVLRDRMRANQRLALQELKEMEARRFRLMASEYERLNRWTSSPRSPPPDTPEPLPSSVLPPQRTPSKKHLLTAATGLSSVSRSLRFPNLDSECTLVSSPNFRSTSPPQKTLVRTSLAVQTEYEQRKRSMKEGNETPATPVTPISPKWTSSAGMDYDSAESPSKRYHRPSMFKGRGTSHFMWED